MEGYQRLPDPARPACRAAEMVLSGRAGNGQQPARRTSRLGTDVQGRVQSLLDHVRPGTALPEWFRTARGLWVEVEVEKELGFRSKRDIETYGLDAFVRKCKERVLRFAAVQTEQSIRLGYWMDWNDPDPLARAGHRP